MNDDELQEFRRSVGLAGMDMVDLLDDEAIKLILPVSAANRALADHFRSMEATPRQIGSFLIGMSLSAALDDMETP